MKLSERDTERYRADGFLALDQVLRPERFDALVAHFERELAALPPGARPEQMDVPHFTDPALFEWLLDPDVLDLVESVIGPDIALFSSHFICKPAGDGKSVPWHQDAYFWRDAIEPAAAAVTVWLAIDPSSRENGCMRVIPGSHLRNDTKYADLQGEDSLFDKQIAAVDESASVDVELRPGQCSVHAATLVHGSTANRSTNRRCGYTMRYMPTTVRFKHESVGHKHQVYLARGVDRAGNVYADPSRAYPELVEHRSW
ncbi:phytanoyl-CoA dioxygenase family protein [Lentzea tibetensis]|uniref:phytanoyl-CoA dioxygenase family protein n=1 Tax=Lentzea tibetensis TaxID=2591470 RepID=UPI0016474E5B|nr:phytanoyl-CoA dioxygenase family protein [Lentzea tibetensis]